MYCAAPCETGNYALYSCRRCGKSQSVPEPPPFFFPFQEPDLNWISQVMQHAQRVVQEPYSVKLDIATERTLKDIGSGLSQRLSAMTGGADPRIQEVVMDAHSIGMHGYAIGRAVLGTLQIYRDIKAVVNYSSVPDFSSRLRLAVNKFRHQGFLKNQDGIPTFVIREAYGRWVYYEVETRGLKDWSAVINAEIDRILGDAYLLALVEEGYYKDAMKQLKAKGLAAPEMTPMPGPHRKEPPPPPPITPPPAEKDEVGDVYIAEPEMEVDDDTPPPPPPATTTPKPLPRTTSTPTPSPQSSSRISSGLTSNMPAYIPGSGPTNAPPPAAKPAPKLPEEESSIFQVTSRTKTSDVTETRELRAAAIAGGDKYVDCEFWIVDQQGRAFFAGYKFYDSAGLEIPKEKYLKYGKVQERDGKNWFENKLNATQFLRAYGDLISTVKHVTDPMSGDTVVFSNSLPDAKPLRDFFTHIKKEMDQP